MSPSSSAEATKDESLPPSYALAVRDARDRPPEGPRAGIIVLTAVWSQDELERIGRADELQIATNRADGTLRRWVPIWVVFVDQEVYVRTWYRRESGWFGDVVASLRARIRVPGLEVDVAVEDVGKDSETLRTRIDAAYRAKYGPYGGTTTDRMVSEDAAAATLRLTREQSPRPGEDAPQ